MCECQYFDGRYECADDDCPVMAGLPDTKLSLFDKDAPEKGAVLSECGTYRYELTRRWGSGPLLGWVMLNPSTADASVDDPTIRRCIGFARAWNFAGIRVTNLFALRATNPKELLAHPDPVGPENGEFLLSQPESTVAAWGAHKMAAAQAARSGLSNLHLLCLGRTSSGAPRHPLYVKADAFAAPYRIEAR